MKKVLLIVLSGLLIFHTNLVSATGVSTYKSRAENLSESSEKQVTDPSALKITKCLTYVTLIIASVALPPLKIVKVKKYIKELGGIKMTVMLLMGTANANAKEKVATVAALAAEISGITDIHDNCF